MNITDEQIERFIVAHERIGNGIYALTRALHDADQETVADAGFAISQSLNNLARQFNSNTVNSLAAAVSGLTCDTPADSIEEAARIVAEGISEAAGVITKSLDEQAKVA